MRGVTQHPDSVARLRTQLRSIVGWGLTTAIGLWALTGAARGVYLGRDESDMRARLERAVRTDVADAVQAAHALATEVAALGALEPALSGDPTATRSLFDRLVALADTSPGTTSTTVYDDATPLAWAGRPSDIPAERLRLGVEDWFVVESGLALRLVHTWPAKGSAALVVVERDIATASSPSLARLSADLPTRYTTPTRWATVTLEPSTRAARTSPDTTRFDIDGPGDRPLVTAVVDPDDLRRGRAQWAAGARWTGLVALTVALLAAIGTLLDWIAHSQGRRILWSLTMVVGAVLLARGVLLLEPMGSWAAWPLATGVVYASSAIPRMMASPLDVLLSAAAGTAIAAAGFMAVEVARRLSRRVPTASTESRLASLAAGLGAGAVALGLVAIDRWLIGDTIASATVDVLHFSLAPVNAGRTALQGALVLSQTALTIALVAAFRLSTVPWLFGERAHRWCVVATWLVPTAWWGAATPEAGRATLVLVVGAAAALALAMPMLTARYRNGSQAFRLMALALALIVPTLAAYPSLFAMARAAKAELVETRYAPQAINQRRTIYRLLETSTHEIDAIVDLAGLVTEPNRDGGTDTSADRAFQIWRATELARFPVTSSVEVYSASGDLTSRFAFNLPEDLNAVPRASERACQWTVAEEVSPFFAEERRVYHAGRAVCAGPGGQPVGSVVVHAMLDYENLPFTAPRTPYIQALSTGDVIRGPATPGDDLQYAVYGWSRTPLYSSQGTAWPLDDAVFAMVEQSRAPVWATLRRDGTAFDVYLLNDRGGIYALGYPGVSWLGHLLNVAELTTLASMAFAGLALWSTAFGWAWRRVLPAQTLLREIRASFYRKLFLAFVAAVVAPVALLAVLARTFVATEMRGSVEREAIRTSAAASRVVADLVAPQAAVAQGPSLDDNLMVWVRRLVNEDANIFVGTQLEATSERTIYASGLLPTRTPSPIYRALAVNREAGAVARERIGDFEYVVAASPVRLASVEAVMTVPLTARQREIDGRIEALDRLVLLAAFAFVLVGAGVGYTMAERIADPVNRLTRATRRLARGDFDVRVTTSASDELARLVGDFNQMATELERQRAALERTHRIEAWAEMARQVAHDIKNPLTPIQLNAEHLRRVHRDRGEPLGAVVVECVDAILTQVALLRQISSEFSNFASSPVVWLTTVDPIELVTELLAPYQRGRPDHTTIDVDAPATLPAVQVDRGLLGRALTNIIENGLHAMPHGGRLSATLRRDGAHVVVAVRDTGIGMDAEALARAFEPYFSTKARGTGLGLPIAKRNVELCGGTLSVTSQRDVGTTVEARLPIAGPSVQSSPS